jgi:hypothetical protein
MKEILFGISAIALFFVAACNNNDKSSKGNDMSKMNNDTMQANGVLTTITPIFGDLDAKFRQI